ncbi:hypothetical protein [Riemerella anatipestifer]|uniref:hypothetical protein n=1 Tax=Riemerella anatipestifer TaxID=34085 RepID=UPI00069BDE45|nr:hypothetical protein [Riemerella anatipestifer]
MKKIINASFIIFAGLLSAQNIGNSPYAAFGIGDTKYDNTAEISAMAGISTAYVWDFNNSFNFSNPAANTNFGLTAFKVQVNNDNQYLKSNYNNLDVTKHSSYLSNISIAFPLSEKVKFGLGYQPYSSKRYDILSQTTENGSVTQANSFTGEGTLNTIQSAIGYQITPSFSLGLRSNFYFGKIIDREEVAISGAELINGFETSRKIKSWNFTLGSVYQKKLPKDKKMTIGATYTFGNMGTIDASYLNSTYYYYGKEKVDETVISKESYKENDIIPQRASLGLGLGHDAKWFISAQMDYTKGGAVKFSGAPATFKDAYRVAVGGWYLPNHNDFRNYFSRVIYRYGAYYEKGNLNINNTNINEYGISLGGTFPFQNSNVMRMNGIDLGIDMGKRGSLSNNLISERFINFKIGLNFADKWFNKRQYD